MLQVLFDSESGTADNSEDENEEEHNEFGACIEEGWEVSQLWRVPAKFLLERAKEQQCSNVELFSWRCLHKSVSLENTSSATQEKTK